MPRLLWCLNEEVDYYEWEIDGRTYNRYSTGQIYDHLRIQGAYVPWFQTVWNKGGVPRHCFLSRLFVLNRCPTRDRILGWGLSTSPGCLLCNQASETRDHLFFQMHLHLRVNGVLWIGAVGFNLSDHGAGSWNSIKLLTDLLASVLVLVLVWKKQQTSSNHLLLLPFLNPQDRQADQGQNPLPSCCQPYFRFYHDAAMAKLTSSIFNSPSIITGTSSVLRYFICSIWTFGLTMIPDSALLLGWAAELT